MKSLLFDAIVDLFGSLVMIKGGPPYAELVLEDVEVLNPPIPIVLSKNLTNTEDQTCTEPRYEAPAEVSVPDTLITEPIIHDEHVTTQPLHKKTHEESTTPVLVLIDEITSLSSFAGEDVVSNSGLTCSKLEKLSPVETEHPISGPLTVHDEHLTMLKQSQESSIVRKTVVPDFFANKEQTDSTQACVPPQDMRKATRNYAFSPIDEIPCRNEYDEEKVISVLSIPEGRPKALFEKEVCAQKNEILNSNPIDLDHGITPIHTSNFAQERQKSSPVPCMKSTDTKEKYNFHLNLFEPELSFEHATTATITHESILCPNRVPWCFGYSTTSSLKELLLMQNEERSSKSLSPSTSFGVTCRLTNTLPLTPVSIQETELDVPEKTNIGVADKCNMDLKLPKFEAILSSRMQNVMLVEHQELDSVTHSDLVDDPSPQVNDIEVAKGEITESRPLNQMYDYADDEASSKGSLLIDQTMEVMENEPVEDDTIHTGCENVRTRRRFRCLAIAASVGLVAIAVKVMAK